MSKAILVIDMPKCCDECPFFSINYSDNFATGCCSIMPIWVINIMDSTAGRQDWCPLKPMPEKIEVPPFDDTIKAKNENAEEVGMYMYDRGHYRGYNICLDKILGWQDEV